MNNLDTSGSAMLIALVGGVIMAVIAVQGFRSMSTAFKSQRHIAEQTEKEDLRNAVRLGFDCKASTVPPDPACSFPGGTAPENMELKRANGNIVLTRNVTDPQNTVGKFRMRARCPSIDGKRLVMVEFQSITANPSTDPWRDLFPSSNVPLGCFPP